MALRHDPYKKQAASRDVLWGAFMYAIIYKKRYTPNL